jgi:hypothetical protein
MVLKTGATPNVDGNKAWKSVGCKRFKSVAWASRDGLRQSKWAIAMNCDESENVTSDHRYQSRINQIGLSKQEQDDHLD